MNRTGIWQDLTLVRFLYIFGLALMISAIPLSRYFMSLAQFILAGVFLWDGIDEQKIKTFARHNFRSLKIIFILPLILKEVFYNMIRRFKMFFSHIPALVFSSVLLLHVLGLFHTTDFGYAFHDLRTKLPLFLLPLFIATSRPLNTKTVHFLLIIYIAAVVAGTIHSMSIYFRQDIPDTREITPMIHHIRFSLNVSLASFIALYLFLRKDLYPGRIRFSFLVIMFWLIYYLFVLQSITGIITFIITAYFTLIIKIYQTRNKILRYSLLTSLIMIPVIFIAYLLLFFRAYTVPDPVDITRLEQRTQKGNLYLHDLKMGVEDGKHTGLYICYKELRPAWNERSDIPFDSLDNKNQEIRYTLIRYLSSKGYRKDADAIAKLTEQDIRHIENGVANVHYLKKFSINNRIRKILLAYQDYKRKGLPEGYSSMERIEILKASCNLIRSNFWTGTGTGDLKKAFRSEYRKMGSPLEHAKGGLQSSHNQFLNILVMFGIFGLMWFVIALLYPAVILKGFSDFLFRIFFIILIVSMFGDDTLKSQAGVTFAAFFYSFFLFEYRYNKFKLPEKVE